MQHDDPGQTTIKMSWTSLTLAALLIAGLLLAACQTAAPASPTAAPKAAAPTAAAGAAAPTAAAPAQPAAAKTVTVKIGYQPAFTGAVAANSESQSQGVYDYFQFVNDQGGIEYKDPKTGETVKAKLDVVWEDNGYEAPRVLSIYNRQKQAGIKAMVVYGTLSGSTLAESLSRDKIPVIFIGGLNDTLLKSSPRYISTFLNPYDMQGRSFAKWAKDNWKESRPPRLGMVHADAAYGQMLVAGLPEFAQKLGWEVIKPEAVQEPATDTSIQVKRLMDAKPDWVFAGMTAQAMTVLIKDAARLGFQGKTKWVGWPAGFDPTTFQKVADAETDGVYGWLYHAVDSEKNLPGVAEAEAAAQKYRKSALTNLYLQGWVIGRVFVTGAIKGALEKVGSDALTGEAIRNSLYSIKGLETAGLVAPVTVSEEEPWILRQARLLQWKDHKVIPLTDWQNGSLR